MLECLKLLFSMMMIIINTIIIMMVVVVWNTMEIGTNVT